MSERLSPQLLGAAPAKVLRPAYARAAMQAGVVHLGVGAFHRAHQAAFFDALMGEGEPDWMIIGASLRSQAVADQLNPQEGLYTLAIRDQDAQRLRVIGALRHVLVAPQAPAALIAALAAPATQAVTLTITEKGYCLDPSSGALNLEHPDIVADLSAPTRPTSAIGFLMAALEKRSGRGLSGLTLISCDNLPQNGARLRGAVLALARRRSPLLADWIEQSCAFPSTMVDRIVPATQAEDIAALAALTGYRDEAMVKTEPFAQWVVEDWFAGRRPSLERVGVQMTRDVGGWETAKLRLLNGAHSAIAYLGAMAGHEYVHTALAAPGFARFIGALWDEAQATLAPLEGFDAGLYRAALMARFANAALQHRTRQIALDGSQKLPQRLVQALRERRRQGLTAPALCLAIAGWMRWQAGVDENGAAFAVEDPLAARTQQAIAGLRDPHDQARALLFIEEIFGADLGADRAVAQAMGEALRRIYAIGAGACVAEFAQLIEEKTRA